MNIQNNYSMNFNGINSHHKDESEYLAELFKNLDKGKDIGDYVHALNEFRNACPNVKYNPNNGHYSLGNIYITPGLYGGNSEFVDNLKLLNRLGHCRTSAPELMHFSVSGDKKFCTAIYKLNDTEGGDLVKVNKLSDIPESSKKRFLDEQLTLLRDTSFYNPDIIDSYDFWCMTPDTKNVVIDSWGKLSKCSSADEKAKIAEILKSKI